MVSISNKELAEVRILVKCVSLLPISLLRSYGHDLAHFGSPPQALAYEVLAAGQVPESPDVCQQVPEAFDVMKRDLLLALKWILISVTLTRSCCCFLLKNGAPHNLCGAPFFRSFLLV